MRVVLVASLLAIGCGSDPQKPAFEKLAHEAEPIMAALRPSADTVLRTHGAAERYDRTIANACVEQLASLQALSDLNFDLPALHATPNHSVSDAAQHLLGDKPMCCDQLNVAECSRWCVTAWAELAIAVERFRGDAARHGVTVRPLIFEQ